MKALAVLAMPFFELIFPRNEITMPSISSMFGEIISSSELKSFSSSCWFSFH